MTKRNIAAQIQSVVEAAALLGLELSYCANGDDPELLEGHLKRVDDALRAVRVTRAIMPELTLEMEEGKAIEGADLEILHDLEIATTLPTPETLTLHATWNEDDLPEMDEPILEKIEHILQMTILKATSINDGIYQVDFTQILAQIARLIEVEHW